MSAPTLDDVDGDNTIEIILSLKDLPGNGKGGVQIWKVASIGPQEEETTCVQVSLKVNK